MRSNALTIAAFLATSLLQIATVHAAKISPVTSTKEQPEGFDRAENYPKGFFLGAEQMSVDMSSYDHLDPKRVVPTRALERAVKYFDLNKSKIKNQKYMMVFDASKHSSKARLFLIEMKSGTVKTMWVSHGKGSDLDNDGYARTFSNKPGSNATSLGFYLTGGLYQGGNGLSMYLHGLESTNSNAYKRAVVMHGADYVYEGRAGRSFGCPAIERKFVKTLFPVLQGGTLLYIHYNQ